MEKLDNWAEDKRAGLKADLKELDDQIKVLKRKSARWELAGQTEFATASPRA